MSFLTMPYTTENGGKQICTTLCSTDSVYWLVGVSQNYSNVKPTVNIKSAKLQYYIEQNIFHNKMKLIPPTCKTPIIILVTMGILICIAYFLSSNVLHKDIIKWDPLNKVLFSIGPIKVGIWGMSHFILYMFLGIFFSECWLILMIIGIGWEFLELLVGIVFEKQRKDVLPYDAIYNGKWWQANLYDPLFNGLGLLVGWGISKLFKRKT